jgi:hypothetical protein
MWFLSLPGERLAQRSSPVPTSLEVRSEENAEVQSHEQSTYNASSGARDLSHDTSTHKGLGAIDSHALQKSVNKKDFGGIETRQIARVPDAMRARPLRQIGVVYQGICARKYTLVRVSGCSVQSKTD